MTRWFFASTLALALGAVGCSDRLDGPADEVDVLALQEGAGACPAGSPLLERFDTDHDGRVLLSELPERARQHLAGADLDGDGAIDAAELQAMRRRMFELHFTAADAGGDGALDATEVGATRWQTLALADADGDGRVTLAELRAAFAAGVLSPPCAPHHGGMGGPGHGPGGGGQGGDCPHA